MKALFGRTTEMGSRAHVAAALGGSDAEVHGKFMNKCQVEEESDYIIGEEGAKVQQRLWVRQPTLVDLPLTSFLQDETIAILEDVDPHVRGIVDRYFGDAV